MKQVYAILFFSFSYLTIYSQNKFPFDFDYGGQLIGWSNVNYTNRLSNLWGIRYIPEFTLSRSLNENWLLDSEISANAWGSLLIDNEGLSSSGDISPYRLWMRLSSPRYELRVGLQKINFGSAGMLRPLMWFDRMDPRDPLQLTTGVYGLLSRYYFQNNTNIWFWMLYGNNDTKGWEVMKTSDNHPEFGGRIQSPLAAGEIALSYHYRKAVGDSIVIPPASSEGIEENRLGVDGKWDVGAGLWFEYVIKHRNNTEKFFTWENYLTLGSDYTFAVGNGLNLVFEHFLYHGSENIFKEGESLNISALSLNYPLGLIDNISGIIYHDWKNNGWYRFINWNRSYDRISFFLMAYWNPDHFGIYPNMDEVSLFSGKGIQLMLVFNH